MTLLTVASSQTRFRVISVTECTFDVSLFGIVGTNITLYNYHLIHCGNLVVLYFICIVNMKYKLNVDFV